MNVSGVLFRAARMLARFDYLPDQARVPRGNGRLSGRWVDMPGGALAKTIGRAIDRALSVDLRPASEQDRELFKERYGRAIPPAWTDVHVDFGEGAELIARGRDAAGRSQSIYTDAYHERQAAKKYERIQQVFAAKEKLEAGLAKIDGDHTRAVTRLMMLEGIRVGSSEEQRGKVMAYGATTLRSEHLTDNGDGTVTLSFVAKEGIPAEYVIDDPELVSFLAQRHKEIAGKDAPLFNATDKDTMALIRELSGLPGMKNHDLRTLLANRLATSLLANHLPPPEGGYTAKQIKEIRKAVAEAVAAQLRNKPAQALSSYINPAVFDLLVEVP